MKLRCGGPQFIATCTSRLAGARRYKLSCARHVSYPLSSGVASDGTVTSTTQKYGKITALKRQAPLKVTEYKLGLIMLC